MGQNESLPNIKGDTTTTSNRYPDDSVVGVYDLADFMTEKENNAFYIDTEAKGSRDGLSPRGNKGYSYRMKFSANKSSLVYQDGAKVTTKNFTYKIWTREF